MKLLQKKSREKKTKKSDAKIIKPGEKCDGMAVENAEWRHAVGQPITVRPGRCYPYRCGRGTLRVTGAAQPSTILTYFNPHFRCLVLGVYFPGNLGDTPA